MELEWNRARRFDSPMSVLMIDIDLFKRYNDINGHLLGDQVLIGVAQTLENSTRKTDTVARFGGEEFVVVLPGLNKDRARQVAEKLRKAVAEKQFPRMNSQPNGHLSISIGVASYPGDGKDSRQLLDRADLALYMAKRSGRNQVAGYEEGMRIIEIERQRARKKSLKRRRKLTDPSINRNFKL
jgi:diguanylate cyclase (GGDEF)-like protein